jgi:hypothetical protein
MYDGVPSANPTEVSAPAVPDSDTGLRHAEVGDHGVTTGKQHVVGLDVAMDHTVRMRMVERFGHFPQESRGLGDWQLS